MYKAINYTPLEVMDGPTMKFSPNLEYQTKPHVIVSHLMGIKANQKMVGYLDNWLDSAAPMDLPCLVNWYCCTQGLQLKGYW